MLCKPTEPYTREAVTAARSTPRTKPADERRADLLDAGERVLVERGIAAARIEEITAAAGVAKGTFYLYFGSKADLVVALRERFVDRGIEHQDAAVARLRADDWPARVDAWIEDAIRFYLKHAHLHDVLFEHPSKETIATGVAPENRHMDAFRDLLAQRDPVPAGAPDPDVAAVMLYSAMHGSVHYLLHHEAADRAEQIIGAAQQLSRRYLEIP